MKALTILSVAYPLAPIGIDAVGGAEQILSLIDGALVKSGHRSIVIACTGSSSKGTLCWIERNVGKRPWSAFPPSAWSANTSISTRS